MITEYDPNMRWSTHTFELTFMQWDYSLTVQAVVGGNCRGYTLFSSAIDEVFDKAYSKEHDCATLILNRGKDELEVTLEDDEDLKKMCVAIKIVERVKEERKPAQEPKQ